MPTQTAVPNPKGSAARGSGPSRRPPWVWIGVGAVVIAAAIIAIVVSGGDGDEAKPSPPGLEQTRPVAVTGKALPTFEDPSNDQAIGMTAPELRGKDFSGKPVTVTHDGRGKLLIFVAHWCPHCQREVPVVVDYLKDNPLPDNVDLVAIATSTQSNQPNYPPSEWLERENWPSPVLADSADGVAANAFGLPSFPYFVALDSNGKVVARTTGEISTDQLAQLINAASTGTAVQG